jgi:hypothetical protein
MQVATGKHVYIERVVPAVDAHVTHVSSADPGGNPRPGTDDDKPAIALHQHQGLVDGGQSTDDGHPSLG